MAQGLRKSVFGKLGTLLVILVLLVFGFFLYELLEVVVFGTDTAATIFSPFVQSIHSGFSLRH